MSNTLRTRFAPSPTGYLHLGHAYAAQQAFEFASDHNGVCLLRIEDIDHTRCKPEFTNAISESLSWLGFKWPEPVRVQSQHRAEYASVIDGLHERGLVYRCFKTRKELPVGLYRSEALPPKEEQARLDNNEAFAWRLSIAACKAIIDAPLTYEETGLNSGTQTVDLDRLADEVLARKDIGTSYHVACCHDDALQNITHIVRGQDIAPLTPLHRLLQHLMGWAVPIYHHHGLLKNDNGEKLSKRNGETSLATLRQRGLSSKEVMELAIANGIE
ncbi:MAG: tRNA glutamyl-Q(34) synthetase GluQRS [Alphaproteobacteria bacterium]